MKRTIILTALIGAVACSQPAETPKQTSSVANRKTPAGIDVEAPFGARQIAAQDLDQQRFDERWRELQSFREEQAAERRAASAPARQPAIHFVTGKKESFRGLDANGINNAPVNVPIEGDVKGPSVLKTQVYLDRLDNSVGVIDGRWGKNSSIAVWWWQWAHGLPQTGDVDQTTFQSLADATKAVPALVPYTVTAGDLQGPFVKIPDSVYDMEKLKCMCYGSVREKLAEQFHCTEEFLAQLNPNADFSNLQAGTVLEVPNVRHAVTADRPDIARVVVSIAGNTVNAFDANGNLIFHAPTTVGSKYDPSPNETLKVTAIVHDPPFHYDPTLYSEVPDTDPDAHLQPGPNSPVGVVWMQLSKEHYGIHGTEDPSSIGYVSSHGCIRLCNWDAEEISHRISKGTPVVFVDTKR